MLGTGNRWNPRHPQAIWLASRGSGVRHYIDWHENIFDRHSDARLASRFGRSRAREDWFDAQFFTQARVLRQESDLPDTDLCSEDSEDALTWSVFSALENRADAGDWWREFGFESRPSISFWPRDASETSHAANAYRDAGGVVETEHRRPDQRSEIDVLLAADTRWVLVEVKWKGGLLGTGRQRISSSDSTNTAILDVLVRKAAAHDVLAPGVEVKDVLRRGGYQTLRHLLYAAELSSAQPVEVYYLLCGHAIGVARGDHAALQRYRDRSAKLFRTPPAIVLWEDLAARISSTVLDDPLSDPCFHRRSTLREYLAGRSLEGITVNLTPPDDPELVLRGVRGGGYDATT